MYNNIKRISKCALLVALGVILSRFLSIPISLAGAYSINIGFGLLPILLICALYGPVYGCVSAIAWDLIGAILFPNGAFVVWFTLAAGVFGLVTGTFFAKIRIEHVFDNEKGYGSVLTIYHGAREITLKRVFAATLTGQLVYSVFLNSLLITLLYNVPFKVLVVPRLIENAIMIVINTGLVYLLTGVIKKAKLAPERFFTVAAAQDEKTQDQNSGEIREQTVVQPVTEQIRDHSVSDSIGMIGGYICNKDIEKANEIYETVMLMYREDSSRFTKNMKKELANYKALMASAPIEDRIIIEAAFDIDAELEKMGSLIRACDTDAALRQMDKLMVYFGENSSMFCGAQKALLKEYREWCAANR